MKVIKEEVLIDKGTFSSSLAYRMLQEELVAAITGIVWPPRNDSFVINPSRKGNGVVPIKESFFTFLSDHGWLEQRRGYRQAIAAHRPGAFDAMKPIGKNQHYAVEWETGNISSSHRSLNRMVLGLLNGSLFGGTLVLPTRALYRYLTDRVGNFEELEPYFSIWRLIPIERGFLNVIAVEHDALSSEVPLIGKGTDGRALR
jgi:hypothetical protein